MLKFNNAYNCMKYIRSFYSTGLQNTFYIERAAAATANETLDQTPVICLMGKLKRENISLKTINNK